MKRYDTYKPSGVEWIEEIPEHWEVKPIKHLLKRGKEGIRIGPFGSSLKAEFITLDGFKVYGQENIIHDNFELGWRYVNDQKFNELSDYEVLSDDVLITMMGTTGKCKVVPPVIKKGIIDSHLIRMRVDEALFLPKLLADLINSSYYLFNQIKLMGKGSIMEGLNSTIVKNLVVFIPPIKEQVSIADFLDRKADEIDTIIRKKQQLVALLKEERTAIINESVSGKGKNWERKKLKYVAKMFSGYAFNSEDFVQEGVQLIKIGNLYQNEFSLDRQPSFLPVSFLVDYEKWQVSGGDILISMTGTLGKRDYGYAIQINDTNQKFLLNQRVSKIEFNTNQILPEFGLVLLRSSHFLDILFLTPSGTKQGNFSNEQLLSVPISFPSAIKEQKAILSSIELKTKRIDNTIVKIEKEITLLQEYRTALISEVVTGKVKVA